MNHYVTNLYGRSTRIEKNQGKEYLVAPVAMLVEGVHSGNSGPLFYPATELSKSPAAWNGVPIVLYHPTANGVGISANTPGVFEKQGVGVVKNAKWDGKKLRAEAWIDVERLTKLAPELVDPLLNDGGMLEVSTGLFTENEHAPGWYGGKNFELVARNHKPDHLALLPTGVGACSISDGCGLFQMNERIEPKPNKEHSIMDIHMTGHCLFARTGAAPPVLNHGGGGGDRDDFLPMPVLNWDGEKPTNNCGCSGHGNGHGNTRETEADIDREFQRSTATAQNMGMVSNGRLGVLPAPRMFDPPSGGIRLGGGEPTVNGGYSLFGGSGHAPVMNRGGDDDSPLPLPVMTWD